MNVCTIDVGKSGGFAWIEEKLVGKMVMVKKMPDSLNGILTLIKSIPCDVFVLEDVSIRPSDMEDGSIYRIVNVMIKNLHYLEAAILISGKTFIRLHPKRWTNQYKDRTKGQDYADRKRTLKNIATKQFPKTNVTLRNADALLMLNYMFVAIQSQSDWLKEKEAEIKIKIVF